MTYLNRLIERTDGWKAVMGIAVAAYLSGCSYFQVRREECKSSTPAGECVSYTDQEKAERRLMEHFRKICRQERPAADCSDEEIKIRYISPAPGQRN